MVERRNIALGAAGAVGAYEVIKPTRKRIVLPQMQYTCVRMERSALLIALHCIIIKMSID